MREREREQKFGKLKKKLLTQIKFLVSTIIESDQSLGQVNEFARYEITLIFVVHANAETRFWFADPHTAIKSFAYKNPTL